jgi:AdoMet-dependent rRNA methyltransferase SPB1
MPPSSIILGVDLVPIKPIPRCVTFAEDITTDKCRRKIREEIKDWKADVVLHDGAPNVGTAWAQDAFTQSELVLSSLRLATEFLNVKGTFVTKVFRSKDYNSLLWVFNQLFEKVEATKPPSSRNVSAEIFVVCTGYKAPKNIDPKFLSASHVFKDLDVMDTAEANKDAGSTRMDKLTPAAFNVFHPDKKRRAREGYAEGDLTLFKSMNVMEFITSHDPIAILGTANKLDFNATEETKELLKNAKTTEEIKTSADDLRVLGKKDFKALLRWRTSMREDLGLDVKIKPTEEFTETAEVQALTEEEQMALDVGCSLLPYIANKQAHNELSRNFRSNASNKRRPHRNAKSVVK